MTMFWFLAGAALSVVFYLGLRKSFNYWKWRGVPQYHFFITIRELLLGLIPYRAITETVQNVYNDFPESRYCGVYQWSTPTLVIRDPDLIKKITVKDFEHFVDHFSVLEEDTDPIWEKNLFALKGDKWKDMRATLSPSFTSSKMKTMFELISDYSKRFLTYFEENPNVMLSMEMKDIFTRFTNDIIATTAFGVNCDSIRNPKNEFYLMGKEITSFKGFWLNLKVLITFFLPRLSKKFGLTFFSKKTTNFFVSLIRQNIESREKNGIVRPDMIHLLMEARKGRSNLDKSSNNGLGTHFTGIEKVVDNKEDEKRRKEQLSDMDITAQALIFFFAGFDSVSTLMCFMAHEIAVNAEIQEKLQTEVDDTLLQCDGNVTYEALSRMQYMDMVVAETMRKWPPGVIVDRVCTKSYTIEPEQEGEVPVTLNTGDPIWIPIFGIHRDPNIYDNPTRFDPERFNTENKAKILPYQFIPFGVGPRSCIGNRFALMETKLVFFYLLSKFHLVVTEKTAIPLEVGKTQFQLTSKDGIWLGLKARI